MPAKKFLPCCYQTDDLGLILKFLCSRYGWDGSDEPCSCRHHAGEPSLYGLMLNARGA